MDASLVGIFKGVYVWRREGEATGWRGHLICNLCWLRNLKEVSPCIWKAFAECIWSGCWVLTKPSPCCCRNYLFVVLHIALQAAVYAEYTWEVFVYCWELEFHLVMLLLPYLLLAGNVGCFILCSCANPGKLVLNVGCGCLKIEPKNVANTNTCTFLSCFFHRCNNKIKSRITDEDLCIRWCIISERHCVCYVQHGKASQVKTLQ